MRKIILNLAVSLDGYIEGPKGESDWCFTDHDYGMTDFLRSIDTIFFGRKSYDVLISMDKNPYPDKAKYVFTENPDYVIKNAISVRLDAEKIKEIKELKGYDIWLFGGAELFNKLLDMNFVDQIQLSVHPLVLGSGTPLFAQRDKIVKFNLVGTKCYPYGLVQLIYNKPGV